MLVIILSDSCTLVEILLICFHDVGLAKRVPNSSHEPGTRSEQKEKSFVYRIPSSCYIKQR